MILIFAAEQGVCNVKAAVYGEGELMRESLE